MQSKKMAAMQKHIGQLQAPPKAVQQSGGGSEGSLAYKAVLGFLKDKGLDDTVLKPVVDVQEREAGDHPPTVAAARWRMEALRKNVGRSASQLSSLAEKRTG